MNCEISSNTELSILQQTEIKLFLKVIFLFSFYPFNSKCLFLLSERLQYDEMTLMDYDCQSKVLDPQTSSACRLHDQDFWIPTQPGIFKTFEWGLDN